MSQEIGKLLEEIIPLLNDHSKGCLSPAQSTSPISVRFLVNRAFGSLLNQLRRTKGAFLRGENYSLDSEQEPISSALIWGDSMDEPDHVVSQRVDCGYGTTAPNTIFRPTTQNYRTNTPPAATTDSPHIVFGVQGWRWSLMLQGIAITATSCDSNFFKGLRQFHGTHQFGLLHYFSVFRFLNCRFVKVSRL